MADVSRRLVTIVTEAALESELCQIVLSLGASGYTVTNARGSGSRGVRDAGWSTNSSIQVEVICGDEVAAKITEHLRDHYYENYAMVIFESDVRVLRPEKFP